MTLTQLHFSLRQASRLVGCCFFLVFAMMLSGCDGGGTKDAGTQTPESLLLGSGFSDEGIFAGSLGTDSALLVLSDGEFFLLAGDYAGKGSYSVRSVKLTGQGMAYKVSDSGKRYGDMELSGTYKTDRHLQLTWKLLETGEEITTILEANSLYFAESDLEKTIGGWINQDEANLVFFIVHANYNPIASDDLRASSPGTPLTIDVLGNDRDPDGDPLTIVGIEGDPPSLGGTAVVDDRGTEDPSDDVFVYTPAASFTSGTESFKYKISDGNDGEDKAEVKVKIPVAETDLGVMLAVDNEHPAVEELVQFTVSVSNPAGEAVDMQVACPLRSGFRYITDRGGGTYNVESGYWQTRVPVGDSVSLEIQAAIEARGDYRVSAVLTGLTGTDTNTANDEATLTLAPSGGVQVDDSGVREGGTAQLEGFLLSTLTQINGTIAPNAKGRNAYRIQFRFGAGFGGNATSEAMRGFAVISEEQLDDGPKPAMLVLSSNAGSVYVNKLFWVSEDELAQQGGGTGGGQ